MNQDVPNLGGFSMTDHAATPPVPSRSIVLIGMMGAGKTAIGQALAARLGLPFWDSDAEIEQAANTTIADVFARNGEAFFRAREREVLIRLLGSGVSVLSTGGGAWIQPDTRAVLAQQGHVLWLDADLDLLWQRVQRKSTRPLLHTPDPYGTLAALHAERQPIYAQAPLRVRADPAFSITQMTDAALEVLDHADIWEDSHAEG